MIVKNKEIGNVEFKDIPDFKGISYDIFLSKDNKYVIKVDKDIDAKRIKSSISFGSEWMFHSDTNEKELTVDETKIAKRAIIIENEKLKYFGKFYRHKSFGISNYGDKIGLLTKRISGKLFEDLEFNSNSHCIFHIVRNIIEILRCAPHCDLNANNIILGDDGLVHLIDPGIEIIISQNNSASKKNAKKIIITTPAYYPILPPSTHNETIESLKKIDFTSPDLHWSIGENSDSKKPNTPDLVALGILLYKKVTGILPFEKSIHKIPFWFNQSNIGGGNRDNYPDSCKLYNPEITHFNQKKGSFIPNNMIQSCIANAYNKVKQPMKLNKRLSNKQNEFIMNLLFGKI